MCIVVMAVVVNVSGTFQSPINSPVPIYNVPIHLHVYTCIPACVCG